MDIYTIWQFVNDQSIIYIEWNFYWKQHYRAERISTEFRHLHKNEIKRGKYEQYHPSLLLIDRMCFRVNFVSLFFVHVCFYMKLNFWKSESDNLILDRKAFIELCSHLRTTFSNITENLTMSNNKQFSRINVWTACYNCRYSIENVISTFSRKIPILNLSVCISVCWTNQRNE